MRDESLELAILKILDRLAPTPMREKTLAAEAGIAVDRNLDTEEFGDAVRSLEERSLVRQGKSAINIAQVWITDAGRAALRS